jgi:hypothetical protein
MSEAPLALGSRIIVSGLAGSGTSTFSLALAAKTGLPVIHLDLHFWKPGWVAPSETKWREKAMWLARRRRVDRRRQLPRDARSPARTRGHRCVSRHALVAVRTTRVRARLPNAERVARRVRLFGLAASDSPLTLPDRRQRLSEPVGHGAHCRERDRLLDPVPARPRKAG